MKKIHFETDKGEMVAELFDDDAPETVANFVGLATGEQGVDRPQDQPEAQGQALLRRAALPSRGAELRHPGRRSVHPLR